MGRQMRNHKKPKTLAITLPIQADEKTFLDRIETHRSEIVASKKSIDTSLEGIKESIRQYLAVSNDEELTRRVTYVYWNIPEIKPTFIKTPARETAGFSRAEE